jgi:hypothetical protein
VAILPKKNKNNQMNKPFSILIFTLFFTNLFGQNNLPTTDVLQKKFLLFSLVENTLTIL